MLPQAKASKWKSGVVVENVRRIGAVVLTIAAIAVWLGMAPTPDDDADVYPTRITAALAADTENNKSTQGAPQQAVVNGWTARDLLTVIAQEGAAKEPRDQRPGALLVLVIMGLGLGLATGRLRPVAAPLGAPLGADKLLHASV
jgi:hypothetical protein